MDMIYTGTGVFLQECRENLQEGNHRSALVMLREAVRALIDDYSWGGADNQGAEGKLRMAAKAAGTAIKGKVGKALGLKHLGVNVGGKARQMATDAHQHGQAALQHGHQVSTDSHHAVMRSSDKGEPHHADSAADAHSGAINGHQAAMTKMKRVMDQANKEGDHETANWAAQAGAEHTKQRAFHMHQHSRIKSELQKGTYSQSLAKPGGPPQSPGQGAAAAVNAAKKKQQQQGAPAGQGGVPQPARPQAPAAAQGGGRPQGRP